MVAPACRVLGAHSGTIERMSQAKAERAFGVSIIIPCFNEERAIETTAADLQKVLDRLETPAEAIFVNDGSSDQTAALLGRVEAGESRFRVLTHPTNRGYGASLKTGIMQAGYNRIVITDADGTYPNERIPDLVAELERAEMVIGSRQTQGGDSFPRRFVKRLLLAFGRALSGAPIMDINSGLRAMRLDQIHDYWGILPDGFSFTTTITLSLHLNGRRVRYLPIVYRPRLGRSSIRPIRDTVRIFSQVFRTVAHFRALRAFGFVGGAALLLAAVVAGLSALWTGAVAAWPTLVLATAGALSLARGLLQELRFRRRSA